MAGPKDSGNSSAEGESRTHAFGPGDVDDGFRVGEFTDPLAAAAARGGEVFAVADDADFGDAALAGLSHGGDCARLGAVAFRIGGVLDISARMAQIQDTCKKWSQGGRLAVAGAPGDFADDPPARSAGDLTLNLADAEVGGRSEHLDLGDDALRCCRPAKMLAPRLGGSHAGGHTLAYER